MSTKWSKVLKVFKHRASKSKEDVKIPCDCKNHDDTNIVNAVKISESEALEKYLNDSKIEFEMNKDPFTDSGYFVNIYNVKVFVNAHRQSKFYKEACLSCKTCLGWKHSIKYLYANYYAREISYAIIDESPTEYFDDLIKNKIDIEKNRIKNNEIQEQKRRHEEDLAKEICGEF